MKTKLTLVLLLVMAALAMLPGFALADEVCQHPGLAYAEIKAPTCSEPGEKAMQCPDCGWTSARVLPVPALGHTEGEPVGEEATCAQEGYINVYCLVCEQELSHEVLPLLEHVPAEPVITAQATCEAEGAETVNCSVCFAELAVNVLPMLEHVPGEPFVSSEAKCAQPGVTETMCTLCGNVIETDEIPATGHTPVETVALQATCAVDGSAQEACSVCGEVLATQAIPATGNHVAGEPRITEASMFKDGEKLTYCATCNLLMNTEVLKATGLPTWVYIALVVVILIAVFAIRQKRSKKKAQ